MSGSDAEALMREGADAIVEGVRRLAPGWLVGTVTHLIDIWGRLDANARNRAINEARNAGERATERVVDELTAFFALDPAQQRTTPLAIVRSLRREATQVLQDAGVPEVERDPFDTRAFPDDVYGIVPKSIVELGDEDLGGALLAWGMGKARTLRDPKNRDEGLER